MRYFLIAILLCGCSSIPESKEAYALCRAADVGTTLVILENGGHEVNPIMKLALKGGPLMFISVQIALAYWIFSGWDEMSTEEKQTANAISCAAPIINSSGVLK